MQQGRIDIDRLQSDLQTERIGRQIRHFDSVKSTNDEAWSALRGNADDGLVVIAEYQSAGRGRRGRVWHSPRGASLMCSVALLDPNSLLIGHQLSLLTAVAACEGVSSYTGLTPTIKWPNDLMVGNKKLGGILVEAKSIDNMTKAYVIGIGINCLQQRGHFDGPLLDIATSLDIESCLPICRTALAVTVLQALDGWLSDPEGWSSEELHLAWLSRCPMIGQRLTIQHEGKLHSGSVIDVDDSAELVVQLDGGGIRTFGAADASVNLVPAM